MNNFNNDNHSFERLREVHMSQDLGIDFTRERFDEVIAAAEAERVKIRRRRKMVRAALLCLMLCAVCTSLILGFCTWEDATADNDDQTRIVQQGDNLIIGSGIVGGDNIQLVKEEYLSTKELPREIYENAHFVETNYFKIDRLIVSTSNDFWAIDTYYTAGGQDKVYITEISRIEEKEDYTAIKEGEVVMKYGALDVYERVLRDSKVYSMFLANSYLKIILDKNSSIKIETILDGLKIN